jgi:hypothetical protein
MDFMKNTKKYLLILNSLYNSKAKLSRDSSGVEQRTENPCVASSNLALGTIVKKQKSLVYF